MSCQVVEKRGGLPKLFLRKLQNGHKERGSEDLPKDSLEDEKED